MNPSDWSILIQQIISRATEFVFGAAGGVIAARLTFRYGTKRDWTKLDAERKKQQFEHQEQVIDQLWKSIQIAIERASILTTIYKRYPNLQSFSDDELDEFLQSSFLPESQKKELLRSSDRDQYYQNARFWYDLNNARQALYELDVLLRREKIYIPKEVVKLTTDLVATLNSLFNSCEIWHEFAEPQLITQAQEEINQCQELVSRIEDSLRSLVAAPIPKPPSA